MTQHPLYIKADRLRVISHIKQRVCVTWEGVNKCEGRQREGVLNSETYIQAPQRPY